MNEFTKSKKTALLCILFVIIFLFLISQFFAHPVIFNLMSDKWLGKFGRMKRCSWLSLQHWLWIFLHIWCLFDLVMFPFLFAVFYFMHRRNKNKLKDKGMKKNSYSEANILIFNPGFVGKHLCTIPGGITPIYGLYRYVPRDRVGFFKVLDS